PNNDWLPTSSWKGNSARELALLVGIGFAVFHSGLEILDAFSQALSKIRKLTRTEDQQRHGQEQQYFGQSQFTRHEHPPGLPVACKRVSSQRTSLWKF